MTNLGKFFGSMIGSGAEAANPVAPVAAVVDGAAKIIGMFKLSPELKAELQEQLTEKNIDLQQVEIAAELASVQGQLEINKQEAAAPSIFIAGWRPAVGWTCVLALAYAYVLQPFITFFLMVCKVKMPENLPSLDTGTLISGLLIPLLGLAAMRTVEKLQGAQDNKSSASSGG
jgi:Holin of 3TMs, for gene-transfer release